MCAPNSLRCSGAPKECIVLYCYNFSSGTDLNRCCIELTLVEYAMAKSLFQMLCGYNTIFWEKLTSASCSKRTSTYFVVKYHRDYSVIIASNSVCSTVSNRNATALYFSWCIKIVSVPSSRS
jgi:hypothetical protein